MKKPAAGFGPGQVSGGNNGIATVKAGGPYLYSCILNRGFDADFDYASANTLRLAGVAEMRSEVKRAVYGMDWPCRPRRDRAAAHLVAGGGKTGEGRAKLKPEVRVIQ